MMKISTLLVALSFLIVACGANENTAVSPSPSATPDATVSPTTQPTSTPGQTGASQTQGKPLVVTTVAPITNIVSNIAGDRVDVKGVIPEGTDSHTFEPRPSDADLLSKAKLIMVNGLSLEVPTQKLANSSKPQDTKIYQLGDNTITKDQWMFDFSFPKEKGDPNPHLWVNPKYAEAYAKLAAQQLTELDPAGKDYYATNLKTYLQ